MFSEYSIKKPYTVLVAVIMIIVLGIVSFTGMTTDLLPNIELPFIVVFTAYPGASPEKIETTVTRPLEAALGTVNGLNEIESTSNENTSIIFMEFVQGTNMDTAVIELSNSIDMVSSQLDSGAAKPILMRLSPDMMPIMVATVFMEGKDVAEISEFVSDTLIADFERVIGVASVEPSGLLEEEIRISLDPEKIDELNEKVIKELDRTMDETEAELRKAQAELARARETLEKETADQKGNLADASVQLSNVIANLNALLAEETLAKARKSALEFEREALAQLLPMDSFLIRTFLSSLAYLPPEMFDSIMEEAGPMLPEELQGLSREELITIGEMAGEAPSRIAAIDTELKNIDAGLMAFEAMKPGLEEGLAEANSGYAQVEEGKMTLPIEIAKAQVQIQNGEEELKKGLAEFEKAREDARKSVDLTGIIDSQMLNGILQAQNFDMPAGYISEGESDHLVKVGEQYGSIEELAETLLFNFDGVGDIRLSHIANVVLTDNSDSSYAKVNGSDSVMLTFQKQSTASTAQVSENIKELIDKLSTEYEGLNIIPLMDQGEYISITIASVLQNLIIGGILAIIVLFLFLKDFRPTFIIACSIPISLLFAVTLMYFSGVTINIISLSGLALGVGMLVDNSIVVIENIYRMRNDGAGIYRAALEGARQMSAPIVASTLTTVCVFLPIVFTQGISRQIFSDMGLTIAFSLMASLAVALTVVPALGSTVLKTTNGSNQRIFEKIKDNYGRLLAVMLRRRALLILLALSLFGLSIYGITIIGTVFLPETDMPQMSASMNIPDESDSEGIDIYALSDEVAELILDIDEVHTVGASAGGSGPMMMGGSGGDISFYILLNERRTMSNADVARLIYELTEDIEADISVSTSDMDLTSLGGSGIEVRLKGNDLDVLAVAAEEVGAILRETEGTANIRAGDEDAGVETRIIVDKDTAMRSGLTVAQVYQEVASAINTETDSITLTLPEGDYPVVIISAETSNLTRDNIKDFEFSYKTREGEDKEALLREIAAITEGKSPSSIRRENQSRYVRVRASIDDGYNIGLVSRDFEAKLADYTAPPGVIVEVGGENETINTAIRDMILMVTLAIIFIYLIMVAQFQNLLSPFIILFTLPLAFTGGLLLLWIVGMELSVTALLGFLVLAGIVVNNGIVFVDYVNQLRLDGMEKREALIEAGKTRMRPIMMTALTTILAMSTLALGLNTGSEMMQPMAVVTIGGLTYTTFLTLLVIPVMYDILHRKPVKKIEIGD